MRKFNISLNLYDDFFSTEQNQASQTSCLRMQITAATFGACVVLIRDPYNYTFDV
jgi:hypothetical protein